MLRQYIRDLEDALTKMKTEEAVQNGQIRTTTREKTDIEAKIAYNRTQASAALANPSEASQKHAREIAAIIVTQNNQLASINQSITDQTASIDALHTTVLRLQAKHDSALTNLRELERLDRDSKSKEQAARAIQNAGSILGSVDNPSVDDLKEHMQRRNDIASAKFDQAMGTISPETETDSAEVDALLASLK